MKRRIWILFGGMLLAIVALAGSPGSAHAATFVVDSTADSPDANPGDGICNDGTEACTLRAAIEEANAFSGADVINFNIGSGPQTISLSAVLPPIRGPLTIDGASQPGYSDSPLIEINANGLGSNADGAAMEVYYTSDVTLNDFKINNAPFIALRLTNADHIVLDGLDVSHPTPGAGWGIYAWQGVDDVTIKNVTAINRGTCISIISGTDIRVMDNRLSCGFGLQFGNIATGGLVPGGLMVKDNDLRGSERGFSLFSMSGLTISDGTIPNTNVQLTATDGITELPLGVLFLGNVNDTVIQNVDLSLTAGMRAGVGINSTSGNHNLRIQNVTVTNRNAGVGLGGGSDLQILDSTLDNNNQAITLSGVAENALDGGVLVRGTSVTGSSSGIAIMGMNDLIISDGSGGSGHIQLAPGDGLTSTDNVALYLSWADNITIEELDLSYNGALRSGYGIQALSNVDNLTVRHVTVSNRNTAVYYNIGTNLQINCSAFLQNGVALYSNRSSGMVMVDSHIEGNTNGIANGGTSLLIAENNYWGAPDGPSPLGSGDAINGNVDADPFLTASPPCAGQATNQPPIVTVDANPLTVNEGDLAMNSGTVSDGDGFIATLGVAPIGMVSESGGSWSWSWQTADGPSDGQMVTVSAIDDSGETTEIAFDLFVNNDPPVVTAAPDRTRLINGETLLLTVGFSDAGVLDAPWAVDIDWGDGSAHTTDVLNSQDTAVPYAHQIPTVSSPTTYALSACVTDKDSGQGCDNTQSIEVITRQNALEDLIADIEMLENEGRLHNGNGLIAKLEQVIAKLDRGDTGAACNELGAFNNQVNAFIGSGHLSPADGQDLLDKADRIMAAVGCS